MTSSCNCPDFHFEFMNTKNNLGSAFAGDREGCDPSKPSGSADEPLLDLHNPSDQNQSHLIFSPKLLNSALIVNICNEL